MSRRKGLLALGIELRLPQSVEVLSFCDGTVHGFVHRTTLLRVFGPTYFLFPVMMTEVCIAFITM